MDVVVPDIGRKRIRLGSIKKRDASRFMMRIQSIEDAIHLGSPVYREDEEWLRNLPSDQAYWIEPLYLPDYCPSKIGCRHGLKA